MIPVKLALPALLLCVACATQPAPAPTPTPPAGTLTLRWMRSGEPAANMRVVLMRQEQTVRAVTSAAGTMRGLEGFDVGFVGDPNDTWGVKIYPGSGSEVRVPEPIRITGRVTSTTPNARLRLRIGSGKRRPAMMRHRADRVRPYPAIDENVVIGGLVLPDVTEEWQEVPLDASGAFTTDVISSATDPQLVAFDDAGGMTTLELPVPQQVARGATLDAGTLALGPPMALDFELAFPHTDLPVALMTSVKKVEFDPAQRDAIARHLSLLDQFDDAIFEYATGRTAYPLEWSRPTRIAGLPPFTSVEVDVFGPRPSMGFSRKVQLGATGPSKVSIGAEELNLTREEDTIPDFSGHLVLAGTTTPVANATVVYSDYPAKQEATTDERGWFSIPRWGLPRRPLVFVDARASNVPAEYRTTALVPVTRDDINALGFVTLQLPRKTTEDDEQKTSNNFLNNIDDICTYGKTTIEEMYPACQGAVQSGQSTVQGYVFNCFANTALTALEFSVAEPGVWQVIYAYTPFVLFGTNWVTVTRSPDLADMVPISNIVSRVLLRFCADSNCFSQVGSTPFQISSYLSDPDTFEGTADTTGNFIINCINTNPLYVYVNYTTKFGQRYVYDGEAYVQNNGTVPIVLTRVSLAQSAWRKWRRETRSAFALSSSHPFRR